MIVDYHVHLEEGPFTLPWLEQFMETARTRGVDEICFTEHSYRFHQAHGLLDNDWAREREEADLDEYVRLIEDAKAAGYPVKLGIEMDYVPGKEEAIAAFLSPYPWDLVLGSVHWLGDWGVDLDPRTWRGLDVARIYRDYYATMCRAAESGLFDVFSHPDLVKIFKFRPDEDVSEAAEAMVAAAKRAGMCLEVSSAGLRKPVKEIYPARDILETARRYGVPITLASDAHHPRHVGHAYPEIIEYACAAGYREVSVFTGRQRAGSPLTAGGPGERPR